jgi:hypothetical protein
MQVKTEYTSAMSRKYPEAVVVAIARESPGKYNPFICVPDIPGTPVSNCVWCT